jgi:amidase
VRVPAAFCGLCGIRPSHGALATDGVLPMAPSFDAIGWFTAGPGLLRAIGALLLPAASPVPITRIFCATDMTGLADGPIAEAVRRVAASLGAAPMALAPDGTEAWREAFRVIQGHEIWRCHGEFISQSKPRFGPGVAERMEYASRVTDAAHAAAVVVREAAHAAILALLPPGSVIVMPTAPCPPPFVDADAATLDAFRTRTMALTCAAGLAGLPQVNLPLATTDGLPAGLSLLGSPGSDRALLDLACAVAPACGL